MNLFQALALPALGGLLLFELWLRLAGKDRGPASLLRLGLWLAAMVAIAWPNLITQIAGLIGIRRGADLVLYLFALAFLGTTFYFYSRCARLERQVTHVVRFLAIEHATKDSPPGGQPQNRSDTHVPPQ